MENDELRRDVDILVSQCGADILEKCLMGEKFDRKLIDETVDKIITLITIQVEQERAMVSDVIKEETISLRENAPDIVCFVLDVIDRSINSLKERK